MNFVLIFLISFIQFCYGYSDESNCETNSYDECMEKVHRSCNHETSYTQQELENVRIYLIERFAKTKPIRKPCDRLRVRKDIKCMSENEIKHLFDVFVKLYETGVVAKMTKIHNDYWPEAHKFSDGLLYHKNFINKMEEEMIKINPSIAMPYWGFTSESFNCEKSIVWKYFGLAGNENNNHCIVGGKLANINVTYPENRCVKREWNKDGTIPDYEPIEWMTANTQMGIRPEFMVGALFRLFQGSTTPQILLNRVTLLLKLLSSNYTPIQFLNQFAITLGFSYHFKPHLSIGGWAGDMSIPLATNDMIFFPLHEYLMMNLLKWQLQDDRNLVSQSYNLDFIYRNNRLVNTDIKKDVQIYWTNVTIKETLQHGFGENCNIHEELIKPINDMLNGKKPKLPIAVKRLKDCLSPKKFELYFPKFALCPNEVTFLDYNLPDVGDCNPPDINGKCRSIRMANKYTDTKNGRRQWDAFIKDLNIDITPAIIPIELFYEQFIRDLQNCSYCSPYI